MNYKQILIALAILAALAVVFGFLSSKMPGPQSMPMQYVLEGEQIGEGTLYRYTKEAPGYFVEVEYPRPVALADAAAAQKAQLALETGLQSIVAAFETDAATMLTADELARLEERGTRYELNLTFKEYRLGDSVSYLFSIYQDTGGAHPNGFFHTFVFSPEGNEVALSDLFTPGSNYLERISNASAAQITAEMKKRLEMEDVAESIFAEGYAPNEENFQNFVLDNDSLVLFFPPYQVAAYAAGTFEVRIPLSELADILAAN